MSKQYKMILLLYSIVLVVFFMILLLMAVSTVSGPKREEGFESPDLTKAGDPMRNLLLADVYRYTGKKTVSADNSSGIWWHYPIFPVGSYAQITNNLRYRYNPDEGTCSRAEFCGALYHDKQNASNIQLPLPPVNQDCSKPRVNYYRTAWNKLLQPDIIDTNQEMP